MLSRKLQQIAQNQSSFGVGIADFDGYACARAQHVAGAEGIGLFRTELQFLIRNKMPQRAELASLYARVMDAAKGRPVTR